MEWVASSLASFIGTLELPVVDWTDPPADLNGLVRFAERPILVSARVPSRSDSAIPIYIYDNQEIILYESANTEHLNKQSLWQRIRR